MKKVLIPLFILLVFLMSFGCKSNSPTSPAATIAGTDTPTVDRTATKIVEIATARLAITLTYIETAGSTVQAQATATVAAQKTAKAQQTIIVVTPSITETPLLTYTPQFTPSITPVGTLPPMPLRISASLNIDDYEGGVWLDAYINIYDAANSRLTNAIVTVKNITKGRSVNIPVETAYGDYYAYYPDNGANGDYYEVDVYFNGVTYTASAAMPGNVQINPAGSLVFWQNSASSYVYVYDPASNEVFNKSFSGNSADISSAYAAYVLYGEYQVDLRLSNTGVFSGGTLGSSQLNLSYYTGWLVDVSPGMQSVLPTPTPPPPVTAITINAVLFEADLEGGLTDQYGIRVIDVNRNPVNNAGIVIKNLSNATQVNAVYNASNNDYEGSLGIVYAPGNIYEVDVSLDGIVYTAQAAAPNVSADLSADCNTVSWSTNGNLNRISCWGSSFSSYLDRNLTGSSMDISSIYTDDGVYSINLMSYNAYAGGGETNAGLQIPFKPGTFAGASPGSYIAVGYQVGWDVEVTSP